MISIILAGASGAVTVITVLLLFRRLREDLNWQLTALRAERNSEWIMRAIVSAPNGTTAPSGGSVQAAAVNGEHLNPPPPLPDPLRGQQPLLSKRHLHLLPPIAAAVLALTEFLREAWREHRGYVAGTALGATVAGAATATLLVIAPWSDDAHHQPRYLVPTAPPIVTLPPPAYTIPPPATLPGGSAPAVSASPSVLAASPSASPVPSESVTASPEPIASAVPVGEEPTVPSGLVTPPGLGPTGETPPAAEPSVPPVPVSSPPPLPTPGGSGLCVGVRVSPVLDVGTCLPLLGGG